VNGEPVDPQQPTTAVFYSISNCQRGLAGVSFGNFLIKQVAEEIAREYPKLTRFVTLSPVPGFAAWLRRELAAEASKAIKPEDRDALTQVETAGWWRGDAEPLKEPVLRAAAWYFLYAKTRNGAPVDAVARFHLGNGARLERINFLADNSQKSMREAHGLMVNYRYEPKEIERNHEAYANEGIVAASRTVRGLLKLKGKARAIAGDQETPALPAPLPESAKT